MTDKAENLLLPESYSGREQTYVKHLFLENYIERVAYNILSFKNEFVFVDGFSGPWQSNDETLQDTSFGRATSKLQKIHFDFLKRNSKKIRCLFIEKTECRFSNLERAVSGVKHIQANAMQGEFEKKIPEIINFIGNSFSLVFIDPKGWIGFGLKNIEPILMLKGEVIINFMFDHINRFMNHPSPETAETYNQLFGGEGWFEEFEDLISEGINREEAVLSVYMRRLKKTGNYKYVTSTRVKNPSKDRTYFHLIYATRNSKGIIEFRAVEKKTSYIQEQVRDTKKQTTNIEKRRQQYGMEDLLGVTEQDGNTTSYINERSHRISQAKIILLNTLNANKTIKAEELQGIVLQTPLVQSTNINTWVVMPPKKSGLQR
jgi:three-Cys-motif partner protein